MIGDETRRITIIAAVGFIAVVAIGIWLWLGTPGLPRVSPVATATPATAMAEPTEEADLWPTHTSEPTDTPEPTETRESRTVDDFGFPPGYQPPVGAQPGAQEQIPDLKKIVPVTPTPQPAPAQGQPEQPTGGPEAQIGEILEKGREAIGQVRQGLAPPTPTPTPTPTLQPAGILWTPVGRGLPGWLKVGLSVIIVLTILIVLGFVTGLIETYEV